MNNHKKLLIYCISGLAVFVVGLISGWELNVRYTNKPAFESLAIGMTDTMYRSAFHLKAIHTGKDEIFKDILIQQLKGGLELLPSIEPYLVTDWGRKTLNEWKTYTLTILGCVESKWESPECEKI